MPKLDIKHTTLRPRQKDTPVVEEVSQHADKEVSSAPDSVSEDKSDGCLGALGLSRYSVG